MSTSKIALLNRISKNLILIAVFYLPFTRILTFEIGFTLKISQILFIIAAFIQLLKRIIVRGTLLKTTPIDKAIILFWLLAAASIINSYNTGLSLIHLLWLSFSIGAIYFNLKTIIDSEKDIRDILTVLLISSLIASIFGLYQYFGDYLNLPTGLSERYTKEAVLKHPRIQSFMLEPLYFAHFLLFTLSILITSSISKKNLLGINYRLILILLLLIMQAFLLTYSRGGWVGLTAILITLIILLIYLFSLNRSSFNIVFSKSRIFALIILIIISLNGVSVSIKVGERLNRLISPLHVTTPTEAETESDSNQEKPRENSTPSSSTDNHQVENMNQSHISTWSILKERLLSNMAITDRQLLWEKAINYFKESPIIGIGIGNFGARLAQEEAEIFRNYSVINNQILTVFTETGILGGITYLIVNIIFLLGLIKNLLKNYYLNSLNWVGFYLATIIGFVGIWAQFMVMSGLNVMYYWVILGLSTAKLREHQDDHEKK